MSGETLRTQRVVAVWLNHHEAELTSFEWPSSRASGSARERVGRMCLSWRDSLLSLRDLRAYLGKL
jgi:hypothetical protein